MEGKVVLLARFVPLQEVLLLLTPSTCSEQFKKGETGELSVREKAAAATNIRTPTTESTHSVDGDAKYQVKVSKSPCPRRCVTFDVSRGGICI